MAETSRTDHANDPTEPEFIAARPWNRKAIVGLVLGVVALGMSHLVGYALPPVMFWLRDNGYVDASQVVTGAQIMDSQYQTREPGQPVPPPKLHEVLDVSLAFTALAIGIIAIVYGNLAFNELERKPKGDPTIGGGAALFAALSGTLAVITSGVVIFADWLWVML